MTAITVLVILKSDLANSDPLQRMVVIGSDTCQMLVLETFTCALPKKIEILYLPHKRLWCCRRENVVAVSGGHAASRNDLETCLGFNVGLVNPANF